MIMNSSFHCPSKFGIQGSIFCQVFQGFGYDSQIPKKNLLTSVWQTCNQSCVVFSSIGAEILAAATSVDRGSMMSKCLTNLYKAKVPLPFVLTVD